MRAYIAGPMRGRPHLNFPAFDEAAQFLRSTGADVVSPAEMDRALFGWPTLPDPETVLEGFDYEDAMARDFAAIDTCDAIVLLPGWRESEGAQRELAYATTSGLYRYTYDTKHRHRRLDKLDLYDRADPALISKMTSAARTYRTAEQNEILGTLADLLAGPTGDGAAKRSAGLKECWKDDTSHYAAAMRHIERWLAGEQVDQDSGCHPLSHATWRLLVVAWQDLNTGGQLPGDPE